MVIEVISPRDRAAWLKARGQDVTASVVGALFGVHDFVTPYELWAVKTGRAPRQAEENDAMRRGRLLEPVAVQILREERPDWQITYSTEAQTYYRDTERRLGATPDVIAVCPRRGRGVVQIKSVEAGVYRRKWIDADGNPEAPLWIALQATLEAYLTGAQWAAVMPLVIGFGVEAPLIDVPLDHMPGVIDAMSEKAAEFWEMVRENREPPIDYTADAALIDRLYEVGDPRAEADLTGVSGLLEDIQRRGVVRREMQEREAEVIRIETRIKSLMGEAELAHLPGGMKATWKTQKRRMPDGRVVISRPLRLPNL
jgi:predicted phage-related endonuclease